MNLYSAESKIDDLFISTSDDRTLETISVYNLFTGKSKEKVSDNEIIFLNL